MPQRPVPPVPRGPARQRPVPRGPARQRPVPQCPGRRLPRSRPGLAATTTAPADVPHLPGRPRLPVPAGRAGARGRRLSRPIGSRSHIATDSLPPSLLPPRAHHRYASHAPPAAVPPEQTDGRAGAAGQAHSLRARPPRPGATSVPGPAPAANGPRPGPRRPPQAHQVAASPPRHTTHRPPTPRPPRSRTAARTAPPQRPSHAAGHPSAAAGSARAARAAPAAVPPPAAPVPARAVVRMPPPCPHYRTYIR